MFVMLKRCVYLDSLGGTFFYGLSRSTAAQFSMSPPYISSQGAA